MNNHLLTFLIMIGITSYICVGVAHPSLFLITAIIMCIIGIYMCIYNTIRAIKDVVKN